MKAWLFKGYTTLQQLNVSYANVVCLYQPSMFDYLRIGE